VHPAAALSVVTVRQSPSKHCARLTRMGPTCHMPCLASVLPCSSWSTCTNGQKTCTLQPLHCFEGHSCGVKRQTQHRTQCPRTRLWITCCAHVISTQQQEETLFWYSCSCIQTVTFTCALLPPREQQQASQCQTTSQVGAPAPAPGIWGDCAEVLFWVSSASAGMPA
jgi:hypothetical protein